jgi:hypothetical protein
VQTTITDDADTVTVKLEATQSTGEDGGSITYTASLVDAAGKPVTTNNDITVTLANGEVITIAAGSASAASDPVAVNRDDVFRKRTASATTSHRSAKPMLGQDGALEQLVADDTPVKTHPGRQRSGLCADQRGPIGRVRGRRPGLHRAPGRRQR